MSLAPNLLTMRPVPNNFGAQPPNANSLDVSLDVVDGVLNRLDLLGVFVGNLKIKLLLEGKNELDHGERVGFQIVDKRCFGLELILRDLKLLTNEVVDFGFNFFRRHSIFLVFFFVITTLDANETLRQREF